ncbi:MAG: hypothetical protein CVT49_16145 [candidate division Zixibacteria bacterium HGW-Zixibacteria-1]|nr:MAG: hypothetical protein CVT49_16145 [candidate division Zixibacteria bacterium HGW-Zixibacteria-1]
MPIHYPKSDFIDFYISMVPDKGDAYALYDKTEAIFFGSTRGSIREELYKHKRGLYGSCTRTAVYFNHQPTLFPDYKYRELMREFEKEHGRKPRCMAE